MNRNPEHPILSPVRKSLLNYCRTYDQSSEEMVEIEQAVCNLLTEKVTWLTKRDSDGVRQIQFKSSGPTPCPQRVWTAAEDEPPEVNDAKSEGLSLNILSIAIIARNVTILRKLHNSNDAQVNAGTLGSRCISRQDKDWSRSSKVSSTTVPMQMPFNIIFPKRTQTTAVLTIATVIPVSCILQHGQDMKVS